MLKSSRAWHAHSDLTSLESTSLSDIVSETGSRHHDPSFQYLHKLIVFSSSADFYLVITDDVRRYHRSGCNVSSLVVIISHSRDCILGTVILNEAS